MMQPAFEIGTISATGLPAEARLLIEVSAQAFNYIVYTRNPNQLLFLRQYRMYTTSERSTCDLLEEIIAGDEVIAACADKALVVYNFPGADLVPAALFDSSLKKPIARLLTGETGSDFLFDEPVGRQELKNIYRVAKDLHLLCKEKFKGSQFWHVYTLLLQWPSNYRLTHGHGLRAVFYNDKFIVAYFHDGQLRLIQSVAYQTPEDVAYFLLSLCRQFEVSQQELSLVISGLIDGQSALYSELLKYFAQVSYEEIPEEYDISALQEEFPGHYFSPLLNMSLCV